MSIRTRLYALVSGAALSALAVFPAFADPEALLRAFPTASLGDLTADGVPDAVVQPADPDALGAVVDGASEARIAELPANYLGLDWRVGTSRVVTGNVDGLSGDDVILQSRARGGSLAVVLSDALGTPALGVQTWRDGFLGRHWAARDVKLYSGDLDGDGRDDLLVQVLNDDLFAAPYRESAYALLLADDGGVFTRINTTWDRDSFDANWDPAKSDLQIGDVDGDGIADIALMARALTGMHQLLLGTPKGVFTDVAARWRGTATPAEAYAQSIASFAAAVIATSGELQAETTGPKAGTRAGGISTMSFPAGTAAVGALAGEAGVSGGAATYSIPIVVPPGRAGMQPAVSVGYSSRAGNGELGMGWSLNAGSSIHRCPQTQAQDGKTIGVTYSQTDDRLCLDGQRLVAVSGTYGVSGAVYRTELESYARVEQTTNINNTASTFVIKYADGRKAYYGGAGANFVPSGASYPLNWLLSRVEDAATNSIIYSYTFTTGEYHVNEITYTGRGTTAGDRKVVFTWEDRDDDSVSYLYDSLTRQTKRLAMISTWYSTLPVREYRFSYGTNSVATGRNLLADIEECAYQASTLYCLPKTTLQWSAPTNPQAPAITFDAPSWATAGQKTSDGKAGRITPAADTLTPIDMVVGATESTNEPSSTLYAIQPGASFLGKGRRELWYQAKTNGSASIVEMLRFDTPTTMPAAAPKPVGVTWPTIEDTFWDPQPDPRDRYADFNNDGRMDLLDVSQIRIALLDASGNPTSWQANDAKTTASGTPPLDGFDFKVADFTGDGKLDVVAVTYATGSSTDRRIVLYRNVTSDLDLQAGEVMSFAPSVELANPDEYTVVIAGQTVYSGAELIRVEDVTGDGRPDVLFKANDNADLPQPVNKLLVNTSLGGTYSAQVVSSATTDSADVYLPADVNGDGLVDVIHREQTQLWRVKINKGNNVFASSDSTGIEIDPVSCESWQECSSVNAGKAGRIATRVGDIDNDGRDELLVPIARVATFCMANQTYLDQEGEWATEDLCGNRLFNLVPDDIQFDESIYTFAAYRIVEASPGDWVGVDTGIRFNAPGSGFNVADANGDGLNDLSWAVNRDANLMYYSDDAQCGSGCSYTFPNYGNYLSIAKQSAPDMLVQVTDGLGRKAGWVYDPLSSGKATLTGNTTATGGSALYAATGDYEDDQHFYFTSTMYVVSEFWTTHHGDTSYGDTSKCAAGGSPCETGWYARKYAYREAMYNNVGRGFMGFRTVIEEDPQRGLRTINTFHQKHPKAGQLEASVTERTSDGYDLATTANTWTAINPIDANTTAVVLDYADQYTYHLSGGTPIHVTSDPSYGTAGCASGSTAVTTDEFGTYTQVAANTWTVDTGTNWWPCKLTSKTETASASINARHGESAHTAPAKSIKTDYTYNSRRQVLTEIVGPSPADAALTRTTTYTYEDNTGHAAYGNLKTVTVSGGSGTTVIASRTTTTAWSTDGYFVQTVTNPLGHVVTTGISPLHGQPTGVSDPNSIDTVITYDAFGRKVSAQTETLPAQSIAYTDCPTTCDSVARSRYKVTTTQSGTPTQTAYFDALNRTIRAQSQAFGAGQNVVSDTFYDHKGRVKKATEPFYLPNATPPATVTNTFDLLDRPTNVSDPKGLTLTYLYTGLITAVTASDGTISQTTTTEKNALGQLITSIDHLTNKTHFRYDAQGNPVSIKDAIGATVTAVYNAIGQKTSLSDPDLGNWTYAYDVLGNLKTQTDAKSQATQFVYNTLNQMTQRDEPSTGVNCGTDIKGRTLWTYGITAPDVGLLTEMKGCDGVNTVKEIPTRDALSRVTKLRTMIGTANYDVETTYDSLGRVDTVAYPDPYNSGGSGVPGAPTNLWLDPETSFDGDMTVHWSAPTTGGAVTEYRIYKKKSTQSWSTYQTTTGSGFQYFYSGLSIGIWNFKVQACNAAGCGPESAVVNGEVENGGFFMLGGGFETESLVMSNPTRFIVKQVYNAQGYLSQVRDLTTDALYWQADALNQYGAIQNETFGNGRTTTRAFKTGTAFVESIITSNNTQNLSYLWSAFGHLTKRTSNNSGITPNMMEEQFTYDLLNRVDTAQVRLNSGSWVTVMDMAYDAVGNITQKIDTTGTKNYTYHATKKHAVITAGSTSYTYDNNGNMLTRGGVTQTWDAANFPVTLTNGTYSAAFNYGPSRARYKQVASYSGRTETTFYVGSLYEKVTKTNTTNTEHRYLVTAGGLPVAKVTDVQPTSGSVTRTTTYFHRDHLGSVDTITDEAGAVLTRMSFDAHGNRRSAMTSQGTAWQALLGYASSVATIDGFRAQHTRGFTDHEMLDNVGLVHMNGRVYDPAIGRFISVDPLFQFPTNAQSLNPYSYVLNSPLSHIDPTGYGCEDDPSECDNNTGNRNEDSQQKQEKSESKTKYKESANTRRGGTTIHYGRGDTTTAERQAGKQDNGMVLSEKSRGEFANTKRGGPDSIGTPASRANRVSLAGGEGEGQFVEPSAGDIDIVNATDEQISALSPEEQEFVLTQRALVSATTQILEGNVAAARGGVEAGTASAEDVEQAMAALDQWKSAMRTYSPTTNGTAAAQTYGLEDGRYEVVYFKPALTLLRQGNSMPNTQAGYFVKVPSGVSGLLYLNIHESGHMVRSRALDSAGFNLPQTAKENNADKWLQQMIDQRIVR